MEYSKEQFNLLASAAEEIVRINVAIAELEEQKQQFLAVFKNEENGLVPSKTAYDFGRVEVKVSKNERLDDGLAKRALPRLTYSKVVKTSLDTTAARKILSPEELEKITKKYDNKIEVRLK